MGNAIYCRNGHFIDVLYETMRARSWDEVQMFSVKAEEQIENVKKYQFCTQCGAPAIRGCPQCQAPIEFDLPGFKPAYCGGCGNPYPWTESALMAAKEYADELDLDPEDKAKLKATFDELTVDTPRTELAVHRFKNFVRKIGPTAGDVLTKIIVNVATEAAKKGMGA
jgi:hypothetical protein